MKHIDQKRRGSVGRFDPFHSKWPVFNVLFGRGVRAQKESLWEPLWSESVNYDSSKCLRLPRRLFISTKIINMQQSMLPEKSLFLSFYSPHTKFRRSKLHIQSIFVCVFNPVKHAATFKDPQIIGLRASVAKWKIWTCLYSNNISVV